MVSPLEIEKSGDASRRGSPLSSHLILTLLGRFALASGSVDAAFDLFVPACAVDPAVSGEAAPPPAAASCCGSLGGRGSVSCSASTPNASNSCCATGSTNSSTVVPPPSVLVSAVSTWGGCDAGRGGCCCCCWGSGVGRSDPLATAFPSAVPAGTDASRGMVPH